MAHAKVPPLPGANFTNVLCVAFTLVDPESIKKIDKLTVFFTLLGSASVKAVRRTLMKLSPDQSDKEGIVIITTNLYGFIFENCHNKWSSQSVHVANHGRWKENIVQWNRPRLQIVRNCWVLKFWKYVNWSESISSTFYAQIFHTKMLCAAFFSYISAL